MKRSGALRRTGRLARRTWLSQRAKRPKRARAAKQDPEYLAWVREQRCSVAAMFDPFAIGEIGACSGPIEADHVGERGLGEKCPDSEAVAMCATHHRERHDVRGFFAGTTREQRAAWYAEWIEATRERWLAQTQGEQR